MIDHKFQRWSLIGFCAGRIMTEGTKYLDGVRRLLPHKVYEIDKTIFDRTAKLTRRVEACITSLMRPTRRFDLCATSMPTVTSRKVQQPSMTNIWIRDFALSVRGSWVWMAWSIGRSMSSCFRAA